MEKLLEMTENESHLSRSYPYKYLSSPPPPPPPSWTYTLQDTQKIPTKILYNRILSLSRKPLSKFPAPLFLHEECLHKIFK